MKTHTNPNPELKGLPVQSCKSVVGAGASGSSRNSSSSTDTRPRIDMAQRQTNRQLGTQALLTLLRSQAPALYDVAQIVGKWVWV